MTVAQQGGILIPQQLDGTAVTDSAERFRQGSVDPAAFLNLVSSFCIPGRGNNIYPVFGLSGTGVGIFFVVRIIAAVAQQVKHHQNHQQQKQQQPQP